MDLAASEAPPGRVTRRSRSMPFGPTRLSKCLSSVRPRGPVMVTSRSRTCASAGAGITPPSTHRPRLATHPVFCNHLAIAMLRHSSSRPGPSSV
ncbi:MAG: hypothetical protein U0835_18570 [Isosphaeraceae bacterium]